MKQEITRLSLELDMNPNNTWVCQRINKEFLLFFVFTVAAVHEVSVHIVAKDHHACPALMPLLQHLGPFIVCLHSRHLIDLLTQETTLAKVVWCNKCYIKLELSKRLLIPPLSSLPQNPKYPDEMRQTDGWTDRQMDGQGESYI